MKKKQIIIISAIAILVIGWFVAASLFGPNSERGIAKEVERLQADSIALNGNFVPKGKYTTIEDVWTEVKKIEDYGKPLRYGNTPTDSTRLFSNEQTASLARYNIAKCDSVLSDVLPLWRSMAMFALEAQLKSVNPNTIVKNNPDMPNYTGVEIYSIRYLSDKSIKEDAEKYNPYLGKLGFKKILYAPTPESVGTEYTY